MSSVHALWSSRRSRVAVVAACVAALGTSVMVVGAPAARADAICSSPNPATELIRSPGPDQTIGSSDLALDAPAPYASRTRVHMWAKHGRPNQVWCFRYVGLSGNGSGIYQIENRQAGRCLDASADAPARDGTPVYLYTCFSTSGEPPANQKWYIQWLGTSSPFFVLRNVRDGRCLDIVNRSSAVGAKLWTWRCHFGWNQRWYVEK
ncbi:MAG: hypothetical protein V7607_2630 [Solirubrobacteraceae bacterium]